MNAVIIEDEISAKERLRSLLNAEFPELVITQVCDSVESALEWLLKNSPPDVIFTDIELGDGTCFDLFRQYKPNCPVIFITAYNEHALEAFKVNAADYLLKPLKREDLSRAVQKLRSLIPAVSAINYELLAKAIITEEQKYDRRYLIRYGEQIRTIRSEEIAYAYTTQKAVFLVAFSGKEYPFDKSLDNLEKELDPKKFFRINRQFIVNIQSIGQMHTVSKSRVHLELTPPHKGEEVIVSTEKSPLFKEWLGQ